jgi:hypothetical protein
MADSGYITNVGNREVRFDKWAISSFSGNFAITDARNKHVDLTLIYSSPAFLLIGNGNLVTISSFGIELSAIPKEKLTDVLSAFDKISTACDAGVFDYDSKLILSRKKSGTTYSIADGVEICPSPSLLDISKFIKATDKKKGLFIYSGFYKVLDEFTFKNFVIFSLHVYLESIFNLCDSGETLPEHVAYLYYIAFAKMLQLTPTNRATFAWWYANIPIIKVKEKIFTDDLDMRILKQNFCKEHKIKDVSSKPEKDGDIFVPFALAKEFEKVINFSRLSQFKQQVFDCIYLVNTDIVIFDTETRKERFRLKAEDIIFFGCHNGVFYIQLDLDKQEKDGFRNEILKHLESFLGTNAISLSIKNYDY